MYGHLSAIQILLGRLFGVDLKSCLKVHIMTKTSKQLKVGIIHSSEYHHSASTEVHSVVCTEQEQLMDIKR